MNSQAGGFLPVRWNDVLDADLKGQQMTDMMDNWKQKELWTRRANDFCVEVSHHTEPLCSYTNEGPNRWCVYAYIYPTHPHFAKFEGDRMWQDAATELPLHGGPSILRWHRDANCNPTSVQVGADYHHDGDDGYTHCDDAGQAYSVFRDADELYAWLEASNAKVSGGGDFPPSA